MMPSLVISFFFPGNMEEDIVVSNSPIPTSNSECEPMSNFESEPSSKRSKSQLKSGVWEHMKKLPRLVGEKDDYARCNFCKAKLKCNTKNGTSSLKRHLETCVKNNTRGGGKQQLLSFSISTKGQGSGNGKELSTWKFDQQRSRKDLARYVIIDEVPFAAVEKRGFQELLHGLCPTFKIMSRTTVTRDVIEIYKEERKKLEQFFVENVQSVCLTTDLWTSNQNIGYMCVTAHFIDQEWKYRKKIIGFNKLESPHTGEAIAQSLEACLVQWGLQKACLTLTVDNASANDVAVRYLKTMLSGYSDLLLDGDYFHVRCAAHILNLIVKEGLDEKVESIDRIRSIVRYVRNSPSRQQHFEKCASKLNIDTTAGLILDCPTRWNSTFLMLERAIKFQKVFVRLDVEDNSFRKLGLPTVVDWEVASLYCDFLRNFYDVTVYLSRSLYVTANNFFAELYKIEKLLDEISSDSTSPLYAMSVRMKGKFEKYWGGLEKINLLLIFACILDPRYKMGYVAFCYRKLYGIEKAEELIKKVDSEFRKLFQIYEKRYSSVDAGHEVIQQSAVDVVDSKIKASNDYQEFKKISKVMILKTEVDRYLEDEMEDDSPNFNVLRWWSATSKYHILFQMARDILAIPMTTVASESAFSTGGRVLDDYRSALTPDVVESLICTQDWLRLEEDQTRVESAGASSSMKATTNIVSVSP